MVVAGREGAQAREACGAGGGLDADQIDAGALEGHDGARLRRVTLVGEVMAVRRGNTNLVGTQMVIDYTVDLDARARRAAEHRRRQGKMPGPQFMAEPDPPTPDADGRYWANVAPAGERLGNVNRHAGATHVMDGLEFTGPVYVPVAGQYSFE